MFKVKKFKSGLTLVTVPVRGIETVTVMVLFGVGSKYEARKNRGVSHFLEHMLFKGTKRRPSAKAVSEVLDKVGGEYNAFTGKEYTGYYAKVGKKHLNLALDWTMDIVVNAILDGKKMGKERRVIIEEMNMYEDTPMQHVGDVFENLVYGDQPAGWDIIGTKKTVKGMRREELLAYKKQHYTAKNCVVCVSGNFGKGVEQKVEQFFSKLSQGRKGNKKATKERQKNPDFESRYKKTDQSHCMVGFRTAGLFAKERYPLGIINTVLGGGMSSRLFLEVREKRGLAYYVHSDSHLYTDSGYLSVQAGLDNAKFEEALKVILGEFRKLREREVGKEELRKAKEYIKGQMLISLESSNSRAFFYGSQQLLKGKIEDLRERFQKLEKISEEEILRTARKFFVSSRLNVAVIGPKRENKKIDEILELYNNN